MRSCAAICAMLALVAAASFLIQDSYILGVMTVTTFLAIWGQSWNLLSGLSGNVSLGHSVFIAVPAYVTVVLFQTWHVPVLAGALLGIAAAVALAAFIGAATLRLSGPYFTLATLSASAVMLSLILHFSDITGGPNGIPITFTEADWTNLEFDHPRSYLLVALGLLCVVTIFVAGFRRSRLGFYVAVIKSSEAVARAAGIRIALVKVVIYCMSAALTAAGAVVYVFYLRFLDPGFLAGLTLSVEIALFAVVGGTGFLAGPILGAAFYELIDVVANAHFGDVGGWDVMVLGFSVVVIVMTEPRGLCELALRLMRAGGAPARVRREAK
jgi:branched-chain amino acid transport system permease protein